MAPSCESAADCGPDECCVNLNRPIGKKKKRSSSYQCQSMKDVGDGKAGTGSEKFKLGHRNQRPIFQTAHP